MTISSTTVRNSYSGDGTTDTFTYNFKIFQDSDIQVIIRSANGTETIKTITTHYTVTDAGVSAGGTVVFTAGNIPTATETVVLRRNIPQTQAIDYIANDPFPAESHEEGLDRATMAIQQIQEEVTRSLKLSKTNTMTSTEFIVGAADRANKILAFDASGEISVTQELGTYKGTDATITTEAYVQRDIVKSTSATQLNNVYICVGDSVVGDLLTDTDHFDLLVDAVSAAASATAAASSATDAETAQTAAETAQTAAELAETNAETAETNASASASAAAASAASAATLLDNFDDVYLGAKANDPTLDNDGDALNAGDLYYNTTSGNLKYYTGSAWIAVTSGGITDVVQDGSPQLGGMLDVNGQAIGDGTLELVKFAETASAVNEITVTNAATTAAPEISATGDDTDIDLKLTPKGAGKLNLDGIKFPNADGTANQILKTDGSGVLSFADAFTGIAWQSVKTADFTAVAGEAYPVNTTSAGFTVTLPATPSAGQQVQIVDYAGTFDTNKIIIDGNGEDIEGSASNFQLTGEREGVILTYIDSTQGWIATSGINEGTDALEPESYSIDFLVVAGGGGGGLDNFNPARAGGGGGAGGYRTSTQEVLPGTSITVTVGDGGGGGTSPTARGTNGSDSSISGTGLTTITSSGGGGGGGVTAPGDNQAGSNGGSGGGGSNSALGGTGNTPSTVPSQGNNGGTGDASFSGGGGGGANAVGSNSSGSTGGAGGAGTASSITGSSITRAGGGGGNGTSTGGAGGTGGGGDGGSGAGAGTNGTINTGGGGGGARGTPGNGGKGVVILAMPLAKFSSTTTGSPTESDDGTTKVLVFNGTGSYTA
jgi:hypothetical protein